MNRFALVVVTILAAVPGARPAADVAGEIRAAGAQMRELVRQGDAARLAEMYTEDAQLFPTGHVIEGRAAIQAYAATALKRLGDFRTEEQEIFPGDGVAVEHGRSLFYDRSGVLLGITRYMMLWKKSGGQWRVHRDLGVPVGQGAAPASAATFAIRETPAQSAVVLPMSGSYRQHGDAIARVRAYLQTAGIPADGAPFGRYFNSQENVAETELRWEVGFFVLGKPGEIAAPFQGREFAPSTVAVAVVEGPHEGTPRPWSEFGAWILKQGHSPTGPAMETWLDGPKTELRLQIEKRD